MRRVNVVNGVLSLTATIVLCLALLADWLCWQTSCFNGGWETGGQGFAASVALGVFVGGPLVAIATMMGLIVAFRDGISLRIKSAHLIIVGLGAIATISLLFRFAR